MPIADLLTVELAVAAAVALVAACISGFAGFGLNLVMTPVLAILFSPLEAIPVITVLGFINVVRMLGGTWRHMDKREVVVMGLCSIVTVPLGAWVLVNADATLMKRAIAAVVLLFTLVLLFGWRYRGPRNAATHAGVGLISGFLNSGVGIGGPPVVLYQLARHGDPSVGRANLVGFFAILALVTMLVFLASGALDATAGLRAGLLAPFVLGGTWVGMTLFNPKSVPLYRRITLAFLLCVSVMIVVLG